VSATPVIGESREWSEFGIHILDSEQASVLGEEAMGLAIRCFVGITRMQVTALADAHETGKFGALLGADGNSAASILFQVLN
jgi:hypothetical protein